MKVRKVVQYFGKNAGEFRESDTKNIIEIFDKKLNKITYRVLFTIDGVKNIFGRYENFDNALVIRDIIANILNSPSIRVFYDFFTLQEMALRKNKEDVIGLYEFIRKNKDISLCSKE